MTWLPLEVVTVLLPDMDIWRLWIFPKMAVTLNHSCHSMFQYKPTILGIPQMFLLLNWTCSRCSPPGCWSAAASTPHSGDRSGNFAVSCVNGCICCISVDAGSSYVQVSSIILSKSQQSRHSRPPSTSKPQCHQRCLFEPDRSPGFTNLGKLPGGRRVWPDLRGCGSTVGHSQDTHVLVPSGCQWMLWAVGESRISAMDGACLVMD